MFLDRSRTLPLSYSPEGLVWNSPKVGRLDEQIVEIGQGDAAFQRAHTALKTWRHFDLGWVEVYPQQPTIERSVVVAVLIQHLGFWSLNGARILRIEETTTSFGFTYGTLTNHAENGEELFEVSMDTQTGSVYYRIRAVSWPQSPLTWIGYPIARHLQERFRRDSAAAIKRAMAHV